MSVCILNKRERSSSQENQNQFLGTVCVWIQGLWLWFFIALNAPTQTQAHSWEQGQEILNKWKQRMLREGRIYKNHHEKCDLISGNGANILSRDEQDGGLFSCSLYGCSYVKHNWLDHSINWSFFMQKCRMWEYFLQPLSCEDFAAFLFFDSERKRFWFWTVDQGKCDLMTSPWAFFFFLPCCGVLQP